MHTFHSANTENVNVVLGTLSHGTLNPDHLIPVFADELERLNPSVQDSAEWQANENLLKESREALETDNDELKSELVEELFTQLDNFAPSYCYFGATEGDGSDFGFWLDVEAIDDALRNGNFAIVENMTDVVCNAIDYAVKGVGLVSGSRQVLLPMSAAQFNDIFAEYL